MKKILLILLIIIIIITICLKEKKEQAKEEKGVFISYIDYINLKGKNKNEIEKEIDKMINNISTLGLNSIILQTNPFNDSIYPSKIYKISHKIVDKEGDNLKIDILKCFIDKAKNKNINVYAWINPYRIRNNNDIDSLNKESYYYKWIGTDYIEINEKGIFLNPAKEEVVDYITKGIKELCENYKIKGVLFDDYYYPSTTIDLKDFEKSKENDLKKYRINNINNLIKKSYLAVKSVDKNIKFGLSPAGNIENNLEKEYLDIENILKSSYIDFVIPQLYYGFENSNKPYIETLNKWEKINTKKLYVALALYKSGQTDKWAGKGINEWIENKNIIKRQIIEARKKENYQGFYIFRYEYLITKKEEIANIKDLTVNS